MIRFPIYPNNKKYKRLSCTTKLLEFKQYLNCSNKTFDSLIKLMDVLPRKFTLANTYYDMKKIYREVCAELEVC